MVSSCGEEHPEETTKKGNNRLKLLKRLSGITWGSSSDTLLTAYKTYVRLVLDYGGELITTASSTCQKVIDLMQNKALRLITGTAGSTPIDAMKIQTGIEPLKFRREKQFLLHIFPPFPYSSDLIEFFEKFSELLSEQLVFEEQRGRQGCA
ncbi:reverse transcriptase domain-containing protein [Caerostris darwini]|uniref:Reverse transcriptase domain-containing protein n=1 Tax=Caerostris darwini TaxID=1538125 RepID=A0AAV4UDC0_9ARAC|nr:reverse transcriptase domain-containing protein [Caerostris darwini]